MVTNGEDAELLDTLTFKVVKQGLEAIPSKEEALRLFEGLGFEPFTEKNRRERELRILNAYDVEVCCAGNPCVLPGAPEG